MNQKLNITKAQLLALMPSEKTIGETFSTDNFDSGENDGSEELNHCNELRKEGINWLHQQITEAIDKIEPSEEPISIKKIQQSELKEWDYFLWHGREGAEIHQFHSDAGYGIKTYTQYNEKDGSSLIVKWSGLAGKIIFKQ